MLVGLAPKTYSYVNFPPNENKAIVHSLAVRNYCKYIATPFVHQSAPTTKLAIMTCLTMEIEHGNECILRHINNTNAANGTLATRDEKDYAMDLSSAMLPTDNESCLRKFGVYCLSYYKASLILPYPSRSGVSSNEEKKDDDDEAELLIQFGKLALEAFDRISSIRAIVDVQHNAMGNDDGNESILQTVEKLREAHISSVQKHERLLTDCGLESIDRFVGESAKKHSDATVLFQKYSRMRDLMRRKSHKLAMIQRQASLFELLSRSEQEKSSSLNASMLVSERSSNDNHIVKPHLTQIDNVQHVITTVKSFVKKYQHNIGSHSFLAGLHNMITAQMDAKTLGITHRNADGNKIVRWKFRGTVLTEACRSGSCGKEESMAYAQDASELLLSFLVWIKEIDMEGGRIQTESILRNGFDWDRLLNSTANNDSEEMDTALSFELDKHLSNANLRRILAALPDPKSLDARATGTVEILNASQASSDGTGVSEVLPRINCDGHLDEFWPWYSSWQFCNVL
mmetsp:Transcript_23963/g.50492  ORF Transcript_23963/g.50492 Transcript_23963/m.50492 type:complete len:514 (-) Transcript_23963:117-1658(-)